MSCERPALQMTTTSSVSGNTAGTLDAKASFISTKTSLPEMRFALDGGSETSHTTCGLSAEIGFGASHGARCRGSVRSLGGHGSPGVQNGCVPGTGRPPGTASVWPGVNGVVEMLGVGRACVGQNAGVD
jgi:hypothetical protein